MTFTRRLRLAQAHRYVRIAHRFHVAQHRDTHGPKGDTDTLPAHAWPTHLFGGVHHATGPTNDETGTL